MLIYKNAKVVLFFLVMNSCLDSRATQSPSIQAKKKVQERQLAAEQGHLKRQGVEPIKKSVPKSSASSSVSVLQVASSVPSSSGAQTPSERSVTLTPEQERELELFLRTPAIADYEDIKESEDDLSAFITSVVAKDNRAVSKQEKDDLEAFIKTVVDEGYIKEIADMDVQHMTLDDKEKIEAFIHSVLLSQLKSILPEDYAASITDKSMTWLLLEKHRTQVLINQLLSHSLSNKEEIKIYEQKISLLDAEIQKRQASATPQPLWKEILHEGMDSVISFFEGLKPDPQFVELE